MMVQILSFRVLKQLTKKDMGKRKTHHLFGVNASCVLPECIICWGEMHHAFQKTFSSAP
jgi:hypothetical protein